jgi:hypothetical protein
MLLSGCRLKRIGAAALGLALAFSLAGCGNGASDITKIPNAYIDGFSTLYERGDEYNEQGLSLQGGGIGLLNAVLRGLPALSEGRGQFP